MTRQEGMATEQALSRTDFISLRYSAGGHPLTRLLSQRLGAEAAWVAFRLGISPSGVTLLGLALFLVAAALFVTLARGTGPMALCIGLFQLSYALDCADGQLARASGRASSFGGWLDVACDYVRTAALATSMSGWLLLSGLPTMQALACAGLYLAGSTVQIHTATTLRGGAEGSVTSEGAQAALRWVIVALCDTATVLLMIGLLRDYPGPLAIYVAGIGVLYLTVSLYLARRRLR